MARRSYSDESAPTNKYADTIAAAQEVLHEAFAAYCVAMATHPETGEIMPRSAENVAPHVADVGAALDRLRAQFGLSPLSPSVAQLWAKIPFSSPSLPLNAGGGVGAGAEAAPGQPTTY
jgi:hypothetical protein